MASKRSTTLPTCVARENRKDAYQLCQMVLPSGLAYIPRIWSEVSLRRPN